MTAPFLRMVGSVEAASEHPIGRPVALGAEEAGTVLTECDGFNAIGGRGVIGIVDGVEVVVGTPKLLADRGFFVPDVLTDRMAEVESQGATAFLGGWDGEAKGMIAVADRPRESAAGAIDRTASTGPGHRSHHRRQPEDGRSRGGSPWDHPSRGRGDPGREGRGPRPDAR